MSMDLRRTKWLKKIKKRCTLCGEFYIGHTEKGDYCIGCRGKMKKDQDEQKNWWNQQMNKRENFQKFIERGDREGSSELIGDITGSVSGTCEGTISGTAEAPGEDNQAFMHGQYSGNCKPIPTLGFKTKASGDFEGTIKYSEGKAGVIYMNKEPFETRGYFELFF